MADVPATPPTEDELTPEEEKKFTRFLSKALADEKKPPTTPPATPPTTPPATPPAPAPAAASGSLQDIINSVLDKRDKDKDKDATIEQLKADVASLKKPKKWSPFSIFNY